MGRLQHVLDGPPVNSLGSRGGFDFKLWRDPLAHDMRERLQGRVAVVRDCPFGVLLVQGHAGLDQASASAGAGVVLARSPARCGRGLADRG